MKAPVNIAILASGTGTNADRICQYFAGRKDVRIELIVTNKPQAGVLGVAVNHGISSAVIPNDRLREGLMPLLASNKIDFVVLAGFLRPVPTDVVGKYSGRMVNIHPALLPKFGGKGMYGQHVHRAVINAGERESGITVHHVTAEYDEGGIIFQARCPVEATDTPDTLADKIHRLEHRHFPEVIDQLIKDLIQ